MPYAVDGRKICTSCGEDRPVSEYARMSQSKDGYRFACKACTRKYAQAYAREHSVERTAAAAAWNKANADRIKEREDRPENRQRRKERSRRWYYSDHDRAKALNKEAGQRWRDNHPIEARIQHHKSRVKREVGVIDSFTPQEWDELCVRHNHCCARCGTTAPLTIDHVLPVSKGGTNTIENIQPLCHSCNCSKGKKTDDYREKAA